MRRRLLAAVVTWLALAGITGDTLQRRCDYIGGLDGAGERMCTPD